VTYSGRRFLAGLVTVLASLTILVTLLAHYAQTLADPSGFADKAVTVVRTEGVQSIIVGAVTNRIVAEAGGATSVQPEIESAVSEAVASEQVASEVRDAATSLQGQLVSGTARSLTLTLPNLGPSIADSIASRSTVLADEVRNLGTVTILDVPIPSSDAGIVHDLARAGNDFSLLIVLSVALAVLALLISPDRARTLRGLGAGVAVGGLLAAVVYLVGRNIVVDEFSADDARTAAGAVWSTYLGGLETWGFVLAAIGVLVAAAAATMIHGTRAGSRRYQRRG
jgi:hypothetical protein